MKSVLNLILGAGIFSAIGFSVEANTCAKFPDYCKASAILNGQPSIDLFLGLKRAQELSVIQDSISETDLVFLLELHEDEWARLNLRVRSSEEAVVALLDKANAGNKFGSVIKFLKLVATAATIANEIGDLVSTVKTPSATAGVKNKDAASTAVDGAETLFGRLNAGLELSKEDEARVKTLVAANAGSRYHAVKAIVARLNELGAPTLSKDHAFAVEQEILLTKAYAIISGWNPTDADNTFNDFNFENSDLTDAILDPKKINPYKFFFDITFTSQPTGDGTIFSQNAIPSLLAELEPHSERIFRWRAPDYFGTSEIKVPWRSTK
jgi:hypothetical protein